MIALTCQAHRGMEGFWAGAASGSDAAKNQAAETALRTVLQEAAARSKLCFILKK